MQRVFECWVTEGSEYDDYLLNTLLMQTLEDSNAVEGGSIQDRLVDQTVNNGPKEDSDEKAEPAEKTETVEEKKPDVDFVAPPWTNPIKHRQQAEECQPLRNDLVTCIDYYIDSVVPPPPAAEKETP